MMGPEGRIGTLWRDWRATRFIRHELNRNWEALRSGSAVIGTNQSNVVLVEFADSQQGAKAIEKLDGAEFSGRRLTVNEARPRSNQR